MIPARQLIASLSLPTPTVNEAATEPTIAESTTRNRFESVASAQTCQIS